MCQTSHDTTQPNNNLKKNSLKFHSLTPYGVCFTIACYFMMYSTVFHNFFFIHPKKTAGQLLRPPQELSQRWEIFFFILLFWADVHTLRICCARKSADLIITFYADGPCFSGGGRIAQYERLSRFPSRLKSEGNGPTSSN